MLFNPLFIMNYEVNRRWKSIKHPTKFMLAVFSSGVSRSNSSNDIPSQSPHRVFLTCIRSFLGSHVSHVIQVSTKKKMFGINTGWIVTFMEYKKLFWYYTISQLPRQTMSKFFNFSTWMEYAITFFKSIGSPFPTLAQFRTMHGYRTVLVDLRPKMFNTFRSIINHEVCLRFRHTALKRVNAVKGNLISLIITYFVDERIGNIRVNEVQS